MFIGRVYSASIERNSNSGIKKGDKFYFESLLDKVSIDKWIKCENACRNILSKVKIYELDGLKKALEIHGSMVKDIHFLTKKYNRSFVSKYMHFHSDNVFIYDDRSRWSASRIIKLYPEVNQVALDSPYKDDYDKEYFYFCKNMVKILLCFPEKKRPTAREIDEFLLEYYEENHQKKGNNQ